MENIRAFPQILGPAERVDETSSVQQFDQQEPIPAPHTSLSMQWAATINQDGSLNLRANWKA